MKRLSIDRSGGQTQNFKQRIKLFARNLLTVVMLSRFVETLAQDNVVSSTSIELFCITRLLDGLSESLVPMS